MLLVRTIIESNGNENALVEPVVSAVSSVMIHCRPWTDKGLAWVEAFDQIPLLETVATMRGLNLFKEASLSHYLFMILRNRLWDVFGPPARQLVKQCPENQPTLNNNQ